MKKCINANLLYDNINEIFSDFGNNVVLIKDVLDVINNQPTIEIVNHGRWIIDEFGHKCSNCGGYVCDNTYDIEELNYCPMCGAKMNKDN